MSLPENPITNPERYASVIAGQNTTEILPEHPVTRLEEYWDYIARNGGGGGGDVTKAYVDEQDAKKVDKVQGKGLSSNDYTDAEKTKLAGLSNYDDTEISGRVSAVETALDGHTVATDVPADAEFTDTVYDDTAISGRVTSIENVIPESATAANKLATAAEVNAADAVDTVSGRSLTLTSPANSRIYGLKIYGETTAATKWMITDITDAENPVIIDADITASAKTITGLTNGTQRKYRVQRYINGDWEENGIVVFATPHIPTTSSDRAPAFPVTIKPINNGVYLSWDAVTGATNYLISLWNGSTYVSVATNVRNTYYEISNLTNGEKYSYLVQARVNNKASSFDSITHVDEVSAIPAIIGVGNDVSAIGEDGQVTLSWTKNIENSISVRVDGTNASAITFTTGLPLRSAGNVKDEIDCIAGNVITRISSEGDVLTNPTITPLSDEELEAYFSFETSTNSTGIINSYNAESSAVYVKNTDSGNGINAIIGDIQRQIADLETAVAEIGGA